MEILLINGEVVHNSYLKGSDFALFDIDNFYRDKNREIYGKCCFFGNTNGLIIIDPGKTYTNETITKFKKIGPRKCKYETRLEHIQKLGIKFGDDDEQVSDFIVDQIRKCNAKKINRVEFAKGGKDGDTYVIDMIQIKFKEKSLRLPGLLFGKEKMIVEITRIKMNKLNA